MRALRGPIAVVAIVVLIVAAFALGGPELALPVGIVLVLAITIVAVRQKPYEPIGQKRSSGSAPHTLVVVTRETEGAAAIKALTTAIEKAEGTGTAGRTEPKSSSGESREWPKHSEVLVLAPARTTLLDRWASDVHEARERAQCRLNVTVESLEESGITAGAEMGDADIVQAVEDQLRSFPATGVVLVTESREKDEEGEKASLELEDRLQVPLHRVIANGE